MTEATIPVDLFNPGQVFACLGLLEAADVLLGDAMGGFDWTNPGAVTFTLSAEGDRNPVEVVLDFLAGVEVKRLAPQGYRDPPPKKKKGGRSNDDDPSAVVEQSGLGASDDGDAEAAEIDRPEHVDAFPCGEADRMSLPIRIGGGNRPMMDIGHWADGSGRESFKLYAGNRSAFGIAKAMLQGTHKNPSKRDTKGAVITRGIAALWDEDRAGMINNPFSVLTPIGGSFNFDPRGAWTAIDAGYSPNDQGHKVQASPTVEFLATWGMENARPVEFDTRRVRYSVWGIPLPPMLARPALGNGLAMIPQRHFVFRLDLAGKNKIVTYAEMETRS